MVVSTYAPLNLLKISATGGQSDTDVTASFIQFQKITCALTGTHRYAALINLIALQPASIISRKRAKSINRRCVKIRKNESVKV